MVWRIFVLERRKRCETRKGCLVKISYMYVPQNIVSLIKSKRRDGHGKNKTYIKYSVRKI
jgi:hypothetical protein